MSLSSFIASNQINIISLKEDLPTYIKRDLLITVISESCAFCEDEMKQLIRLKNHLGRDVDIKICSVAIPSNFRFAKKMAVKYVPSHIIYRCGQMQLIEGYQSFRSLLSIIKNRPKHCNYCRHQKRREKRRVFCKICNGWMFKKDTCLSFK